VIRAEHVTVELGARRAVDDVDLTVPAGELLALVGPNGAGKSTLLSALAGERHPDAGAVFIDDRPVDALEPLELARIRSVLTQDNAVSFPFRVAEVVEMGRSPWARTPAREFDGTAIREALERTDVAHLTERRFTELSGGERARVSLARVLAQDTPVVLLDEPTAALDLRHQEDVLRIARDLAREGRTVVVVLHDLSLAGAYADRVALLDVGRLRALGTPLEVLTEQLIAEVYRLPVEVLVREGRPLIIPRRSWSRDPVAGETPPAAGS
jgi:iron complex transport system ATP-binding protein